MLFSSLIAFVHFVAAFGVAATVFFEWFAFERSPSLEQARRLARADIIYGACAAAVLAAGAVRAVWFEKGWGYYDTQPFFDAKLGLFALVGVLSIYPTVVMLRWRRGLKAGQAPLVTETQYERVRWCLRLEVLGLLLMLLCASLMAHGVGR